MPSRLRLGVTAVVTPLVALGAGLTAVAGTAAVPTAATSALPALSATAAGTANQRVIIVLRDQLTALPATARLVAQRALSVRSAQAPVVDALHDAGVSAVHSYTTVNALSATVSRAQEQALRANPAVAQIFPDAIVKAPTQAAQALPAAAPGGAAYCAPAGAKAQLNPEALSDIKADSDVPGAQTARSLGYTGAGVTVAYMAQGIDVNNPDFIRADGSHVFVDHQDFTGDGINAPTTGGESFLDASSIAAQGRQTYDVSRYSSLPLTIPCRIRIEGVSPGVRLVGLKVFATQHVSYTSGFLQAIDYAVTVAHVDVLNESFGGNPFPDTAQDAVRMFDDAAVAAGTTVVVSTGDAGVGNTIGSPASDPKVISTGASTTLRAFLQTGLGFARYSGARGYLNDNISPVSSSGVTQGGGTVDLVAPGDSNWVLCTPDVARYTDCTDSNRKPANVLLAGGTSESAPLTAGAAALVIQAYRASHRGTSPTPALIKSILTGTAADTGAPADQQGAGLLNVAKAVQAALSAPGSTHARVGRAVLTGVDQLDFATAPGAAVSRTVNVTNGGALTSTVHLSTRALGPSSYLLRTRLALTDATSLHAVYPSRVVNYKIVKFRVPAGVARLDTSIAYQAATASSAQVVQLALVDPTGRYAGNSGPQGLSNYGNLQISRPAAGVWSAFILSTSSAGGGNTGPIVFGASAARFVSTGTVVPRTLTLRPGQSAPVTFTATTPTTPGDTVTAITLTSTAGRVSSVSTVPVILRGAAQVSAKPVTFRAVLRGGNGRSPLGQVTGYFKFRVPAGLPELNSVVTLPGNIHNPFNAYLISPTGQSVAFSSSQALGADAAGELTAVDVRSAQLHVLQPAAGSWALIVSFTPAVSGTALSQPYTVELDGRALQASASGLPTTTTTTIKAGNTRTVRVRVHNSSTAPEIFFVDPRRNATVTYSLALSATKVTLPQVPTSSQPIFIVPTNSTALHLRLAGSAPVTFDYGPYFGNPDLTARAPGRVATGSTTGSPLTQGAWYLNPSEVGPYGAGPAPAVTATASASVVTKMFDPTMKSSTGNLWLSSINPAAQLAPVLVLPGQTKTITVKITPIGKKGTVVRGTLYIDDANLLNAGILVPNGNQVAALPYSYTIG